MLSRFVLPGGEPCPRAPAARPKPVTEVPWPGGASEQWAPRLVQVAYQCIFLRAGSSLGCRWHQRWVLFQLPGQKKIVRACGPLQTRSPLPSLDQATAHLSCTTHHSPVCVDLCRGWRVEPTPLRREVLAGLQRVVSRTCV